MGKLLNYQVRFEFELGERVKDVISGMEGTITGRADYITGCRQYAINPGIDKDGKWVDGHWFDESRLVSLSPPSDEMRAVRERNAQVDAEPGGPRDNQPPVK